MKKRVNFSVGFVLSLLLFLGCGREPSALLRQGQIPIYDFPLYLTEGVSGKIYRIDRDRTKTEILGGLNDPRGVASDRFGNIYVAEYGAGRILKIKDKVGGVAVSTVVAEGLKGPSVIAVDSFGDVFVAQDELRNIIRLSDQKVFGTYESLPTALIFGVGDIPIVGFFNDNKVFWGWTGDKDQIELATPIGAAIDGTGRVYVASADITSGKVYRYDQRKAGEPTVVADNLVGTAGLAVDLVGNLFLVEQATGRIVLMTFDGKAYTWLAELSDPQYLAFMQY